MSWKIMVYWKTKQHCASLLYFQYNKKKKKPYESRGFTVIIDFLLLCVVCMSVWETNFFVVFKGSLFFKTKSLMQPSVLEERTSTWCHKCNGVNIIKRHVRAHHTNCTWCAVCPPKLFDIQMICSYTANKMTRQLKDHCSPCEPFQPHPSWPWHFSQLLLLTHSIIMLDMSIRALRQNTHLPKRLYVIRGMEELANPPFLSLLLSRARGVAHLLLCD